jgi:hypothetical protein
MQVPGLEIDPAGTFVPGPVLSMRRMTGPRRQALRADLNLAAVTVTLDRTAKRLIIGERLWGLLPCKSHAPVDYAFLADLDNKAATGASATTLSGLGIPAPTRGADLVARASVVGCRATVRAWRIEGGRAVPITKSVIGIHIQTVRTTTPDDPFPPFKKRPGPPQPLDLYNTIDFSISNNALPTPVRPNVPFGVAAVVVAERKPRNRFPQTDRPARFILQAPRYPHCFPAGPGKAGDKVPITFEGLRPSREIHALLGPQLVLRGVKTNASGGGRIQFPIPQGTRPGNHLVTIGHNGLAITADCTIRVRR